MLTSLSEAVRSSDHQSAAPNVILLWGKNTERERLEEPEMERDSAASVCVLGTC